MAKRVRDSKLSPGRPPIPHGASETAPQVTVRLDADAEAAVEALRSHWRQDAPVAAAAAIKRAIVETALRECRAGYDAALARVRRQRERDA